MNRLRSAKQSSRRLRLSARKARTILHDKSVKGHPLTDKQRRFFSAVASGYVKR